MYKKILVALENSRADQALIPHVIELARQFKSELLLVHVADGWAARNYERLQLVESEEMKEDRAYLERMAGELRQNGGFAKDTTPFSEFIWADFLRRHLSRKHVDEDFAAAAKAALKLARSKDADYLPGWCGPTED